METLKFVVVLLVVVLVQVCSALGTPLSGEENDGEMWTVENWQVQPPPRPLKTKKQQKKGEEERSRFEGCIPILQSFITL